MRSRQGGIELKSREPLKILGFGTYNSVRHPRASIILDGLRGRGHIVRELNFPHGGSTKDRVKALSSPSAALSFFGQMGKNWWKLATGSMTYRGAYVPDVIVVGYLGHFDVVLARLLFPRPTIVLDHMIFAADTAADRGANGSALQEVLTVLDTLALSSASIAVFDTEQHLAMAPQKVQDSGVVVPVGAPLEWFDARTETPEASVVFYGLYTPLQGTTTIARALAILAERGLDVPITMIGTGQDYDEVRSIASAPNITWLEWVEADELPSLVASHSIALGIFGTTDKGQRVVPNKVYQSMAAGCAMITSDTPPQRDMLGDAAVFVAPGDATGLADAIEELVRNDARRRQMQAASAQLADRSFTPVAIAGPLEEAL